MNDLGRVLVGLGLLLLVAGGLVLLLGKSGIQLGRLPGDVAYHGRHFSAFFPIGTCILLSVLISLVFYLISHLRR